MNAVAITDAVQCFFLLMSFFAVPVLLEWKFGGFSGVFGSGTGEECPNYSALQTTWPEAPPSYGLTTLVEPERLFYSNTTHRASPLTPVLRSPPPPSPPSPEARLRVRTQPAFASILTCGGRGWQWSTPESTQGAASHDRLPSLHTETPRRQRAACWQMAPSS
jgi:hypothetical protein